MATNGIYDIGIARKMAPLMRDQFHKQSENLNKADTCYVVHKEAFNFIYEVHTENRDFNKEDEKNYQDRLHSIFDYATTEKQIKYKNTTGKLTCLNTALSSDVKPEDIIMLDKTFYEFLVNKNFLKIPKLIKEIYDVDTPSCMLHYTQMKFVILDNQPKSQNLGILNKVRAELLDKAINYLIQPKIQQVQSSTQNNMAFIKNTIKNCISDQFQNDKTKPAIRQGNTQTRNISSKQVSDIKVRFLKYDNKNFDSKNQSSSKRKDSKKSLGGSDEKSGKSVSSSKGTNHINILHEEIKGSYKLSRMDIPTQAVEIQDDEILKPDTVIIVDWTTNSKKWMFKTESSAKKTNHKQKCSLCSNSIMQVGSYKSFCGINYYCNVDCFLNDRDHCQGCQQCQDSMPYQTKQLEISEKKPNNIAMNNLGNFGFKEKCENNVKDENPLKNRNQNPKMKNQDNNSTGNDTSGDQIEIIEYNAEPKKKINQGGYASVNKDNGSRYPTRNLNRSLKYNSAFDEATRKKNGLSGLRNLGNSCYMNSVIQCFTKSCIFYNNFYQNISNTDAVMQSRKQNLSQKKSNKVDTVSNPIESTSLMQSQTCRPVDSTLRNLEQETVREENQEEENMLDPKDIAKDWFEGLLDLGNGGSTKKVSCQESTDRKISKKGHSKQNSKENYELSNLNFLENKNSICDSFAGILKKMYSVGDRVIDPTDLKTAISNYNDMFDNTLQQDSQEQMNAFMYGLSEEILKKIPKELKKTPANMLNKDNSTLEYQIERLSVDNGEFLSKCMGIVKTELVCQTCNYHSTTYEPFQTLSLSIEKEEMVKLSMILIETSNFSRPKELEIDVKMSGRETVKDLADKLAKLLDNKQADRFYFYVSNQKSYKPINLNRKMYEIGLRNKNREAIFNNNFVRKSFVYDINTSNDSYKDYEFVTQYDNTSPQDNMGFINLNYYENSSKKPSIAKDDLDNIQTSSQKEHTNSMDYGVSSYGSMDSYITIPLVVAGPQIYSNGYPFKIAIPFRTDKTMFKENLEKILLDIKTAMCKEWKMDKNNSIDNFMQVILIEDRKSDIKICSICSLNKPNTRCLKKNCYADFENFEDLFRKSTKLKLEISVYKWFEYMYPKKHLTFEKVNFDKKEELVDNLSNLRQIIKNHISDEIMNDENSWFCDNCQKNKRAIKKQSFVYLPELLTIHFKRFKFKNDRYQKVDKKIDYPLNLPADFFYKQKEAVDMKLIKEKIIEFNQKKRSSVNCSVKGSQNKTIQPINSMDLEIEPDENKLSSYQKESQNSSNNLAQDRLGFENLKRKNPEPNSVSNKQSPNNSLENKQTLDNKAYKRIVSSKKNGENMLQNLGSYELTGVVNHIGETIQRGHYISYCKSLSNNCWYKFDDDFVEKIELDQIVDNKAYILFYSRK